MGSTHSASFQPIGVPQCKPICHQFQDKATAGTQRSQTELSVIAMDTFPQSNPTCFQQGRNGMHQVRVQDDRGDLGCRQQREELLGRNEPFGLQLG